MRAEPATCGKFNAREEAVAMSKPVKTEAELIAMARAELEVHTGSLPRIIGLTRADAKR